MRILANIATLKTQMIYQSKHDGIRYGQSNPNTGEKWYCLYLNLSMIFRGRSRTPATYKMELFVIVIASSCWLLSQRSPF